MGCEGISSIGGDVLFSDSRFEVHGRLGSGGCASVYEAFDRKTSRLVALKVLANEGSDLVGIARLAREARAAFAINHPNVCTMLGCGLLDDGRPYVAMELLNGETLREYLRRCGALSAEEAIEIAVQVLSGLEVAHNLGVVHRDIKPENIFISWELGMTTPRVKILDFGMCRRRADALDERTLTSAGSVVGTPGYMAPESVRGERTIDPRVDLFAVGLVLFEMLTGRRAYRGRTPIQLVMNALTKPIPSLRSLRDDLPTSLDRIIACATERDPRSRYEGTAVFMHDLLEARTAMRHAGSRSIEACAAAKQKQHKQSSGTTRMRAHSESWGWDTPTRQVALSRSQKVA